MHNTVVNIPIGYVLYKIKRSPTRRYILSAKLFSLYMDELSRMLNVCGVGCYIDRVCVNHVLYADDLCLIVP